jgi:hypothetical protein
VSGLEPCESSGSECSINAVVYSPHHPNRSAVVYNLSDRGVAVSTMEHFEPGNWISLALPDNVDELLPLKVVHVKYEPGVGWLTGCVYAYDKEAGASR